jgi:hypothetical protein
MAKAAGRVGRQQLRPCRRILPAGPAIIPLVVESLADPENFFALQLYDAIQPNDQLLVQFEADDERILEGEQG